MAKKITCLPIILLNVFMLLGAEPWDADRFSHMDFSPEAGLLATQDQGGIIKIWNPETMELLLTFCDQKITVGDIDFLPDGKTLLTPGPDRSVIQWEVSTGKELRRFSGGLAGHKKSIIELDVSPDGTRLLTGSMDYTVRLWDLAGGKVLKTFKGHGSYITGVMFLPDGKRFLSCDRDGGTFLWDAATGDRLLTYDTRGGYADDLQLVPGRNAFSVSQDKKAIHMHDIDTGERIVSLTVGGRIKGTGVAGNVLYDNTLEFINAYTWSPDGTCLIANATRDKVLICWNIETREPLWKIGGHNRLEHPHCAGILFMPDGKSFLSAANDRTVLRFAWPSGESLAALDFNPETE